MLLAWFFGVTGAHKLYLGKRKATLGYLLSSCTILLLPFVWMLSILDGLLILSAPRKDLLVETSWTWRPLSRYFKAALGWFFGVFLLIGGLGFLMEGSIGPGLLVLLGATALLPPVVPSLLGRAEDMEQLSAWIKAGAVVAVFLGSSLGTLNDVREIRSSRQTITRAPMIPFEVVDHESSGAARANWTIRVDFVGERLPTTQELRRIAEHLHDQSGRPERSFVTFWTPQQQPGRGTAFATGHHDPELEVRILSRPSPPGSRVVKSGLTESQRRTLYQKLVLIEDRFPGDKARQRPHKQKLYDQYGVDEAFEMEISVEAIERGWPLPDPVPAEH